MTADFSSIYNVHEQAVYRAVMAALPEYPHLQGTDLLPDIACVALNRIPPRYIRHSVDLSFYMSDQERVETSQRIAEAVAYAFQFVQARTAMRARS